jgi:sugar phosphate permease
VVANGLAQGTAWPTLVGTMATWFRRDERGRVMGLWATNFQAGGVAANALAAWMLGAYGWRSAFFAGAAVLASAWWVVFLWQRDKPEDAGLPPLVDEREPDTGAGALAPGAWPQGAAANIALVSVFYFCVKFIRYALWSWAPFFLAKNFGLKGADAGFASTTFDVAGIFGVLATGWLSDRVFRGRRAGVCLAMMVAMTAACALLYSWGATSPAAFAICIALVGFTLYGPDALLTSAGAMDIGSKRHALLAAGIINGTGSLGSVVQELVVGRAYDLKGGDVGVALGFLFFAALGATAALVVVVARNRTGRSDV